MGMSTPVWSYNRASTGKTVTADANKLTNMDNNSVFSFYSSVIRYMVLLSNLGFILGSDFPPTFEKIHKHTPFTSAVSHSPILHESNTQD